MNQNKKVVALIFFFSVIYLLASFFSNIIIPYFPSFKNINLLSEITEKKPLKAAIKKTKKQKIKTVLKEEKKFSVFETYKNKNIFTAFSEDTLNCVLKRFNEKLLLLAKNKKTKIRIAWLGDSQIEGDFITQDLRVLFQNYFDKKTGVGFVPIESVTADFRNTTKLITKGEVFSCNFKKNNTNSVLFLSGHSFFSPELNIDFKDNTQKNNQQITEKWLLFGKGDSVKIILHDTIKIIASNKIFNRVLLEKSNTNKLNFSIKTSKNTPIYGISSEADSGILIDNFSFRGASGIELKKLNSELLTELSKENYYDLIVLQYGVNLMFKPDQTDYDYYYKNMKSVLGKLKSIFPNTDFLMFSSSDRAFNYQGEWKSAIGIESLIETQAKLAFENKIPFYNLYNAMGGKETMVKWVDSLNYANKDYIHFNLKGSREVAKIMYKAFINDYEKMLQKENKKNKNYTKKPTKNP